MKEFKITVTGESGTLIYTVVKTIKGANSFAKRIANEAFYGEEVQIEVSPI